MLLDSIYRVTGSVPKFPGVPAVVTRMLIGWNIGVWLYLVLIAQTLMDAGRMAALSDADGSFGRKAEIGW